MFRYLIRRILWAVLLFIAVTFITFVIFFLGPGNPARSQCGGESAKPQCIKQVTEVLGLDKPVPVQYYRFLKQLVIHRSLGKSYATGQDVNSRIFKAAPVTASLVFGGAVLWMLIGLTVGVFSALKPRSLLDRVAMVFVLIGVSGRALAVVLPPDLALVHVCDPVRGALRPDDQGERDGDAERGLRADREGERGA